MYIKVKDFILYPPPIKKGLYNNNLFYMPQDKMFDIVFLGSSRTVPFDKWSNSDSIKLILKKNILNLSNQGGGLLNQKIYLSYFFKQDNKTKHIFYFIDPFVLYTQKFDKAGMFNKEPFFGDFGICAVWNGASFKLLKNYIHSKIPPQKYITPIGKEKLKVITVNNSFKKRRIKYLYPNATDTSILNEQKETINQIISIAKKNNTKIHFLMLPTLLYEEPGYPEMIRFLQTLQKNEQINYYDFSKEMQNSTYFRDADHLNSIGVSYFYRHFLTSIVKSL